MRTRYSVWPKHWLRLSSGVSFAHLLHNLFISPDNVTDLAIADITGLLIANVDWERGRIFGDGLHLYGLALILMKIVGNKYSAQDDEAESGDKGTTWFIVEHIPSWYN